MARLQKPQRKLLLRKYRPGQSGHQGSERRCCSFLSCFAFVCVFLNVLVWSVTLMVNNRLKKDDIVPKAAAVSSSPVSSSPVSPVDGSSSNSHLAPDATIQQTAQTAATAKNDFKLSNTQAPEAYIVPPAKPKSTTTPLHIVFQTDCRDPTQDWQSIVFFFHIFKMNQPGEVTQIVTGCQQSGRLSNLEKAHKEQIEPMGIMEGSGAASRFHIHFAPAHPNQLAVGNMRKHMKYFNRAAGVHHWMEHVLGYSEGQPSNTHDDTVIIFMDADMILLRNFGADFVTAAEVWKKDLNPQQSLKRVLPGHPMAQHISFPSQWWEDVDHTTAAPEIAHGLSKLRQELRNDIDNHYATGPPFLVVAKDFYPLVKKWNEVTYPMFQALDEKIMREPYGPYALAAAHLQMPHQLASTFSVSNFRADEAFGLFENSLAGQDVSNMLGRPEVQCRNIPVNVKPHVINYSKRYALGNYIIGKHYMHYRKFMGTTDACSEPLYAEPPDNVAEIFNYYMDPELKQRVQIDTDLQILQMSFMLCETLQAFNNAAINYKSKHCNFGAPPNLKKELMFENGEPPRRDR